ncbi:MULTISPECIES: ECF transporter S component [Carnobacterium]|uniref:ECF transporter S component n=1 Tax=Carnobacterium divergens TaxID=2748 RepID=A0A2R8A0B2_CARDV|nr:MULTISPECIES: ECF transporter S component [Carnobacterium]MCO6017789.1 ECF transporter S component [Carnobacterium divergens]MDT1938856.1 ECF transporter S component [Carnobacterium divergens]MDT1941294.1 ECF transporter S component [Carnobacterium divergens]MDT1947092.1 ECF transporter S component [Carnobacterium divergens]MDT1949530.1 ECF transporter S component [Carnobacterium divergens]
MQNRPNKTYRIAILGILTGIILIQNFVPFLGYIPIPPLNPTIIHITVIVAALTLGVKDGMIVGAVWGVIRLIKAFIMPSSPLDLLLFTNPVISIVPRILVGFVAGYVFFKLKKRLKTTTAMTIASVLASLTNTILVLFFIYVFYKEDYATAMKVDMSNLVKFLGTIVLTNGVAEAIAAGVIAPFIAKSLKKFSRN